MYHRDAPGNVDAYFLPLRGQVLVRSANRPPGQGPFRAAAADDDHRASQMWVGASGAITVALEVVRGVSVVTVAGFLDSSAVQPCRAALEVATNWRSIAVDLGLAQPPSAVSVALLGGMRRYTQARGATITLTAVPGPWLAALTKGRILDLYRVALSTAHVVDQCAVGSSIVHTHRRAPGIAATTAEAYRHDAQIAVNCA